MACKRPVIMTRTAGLVDSFVERGLLTAVPPNDPTAMRAAISHLLSDREAARRQAERGFKQVYKHYNAERYVAELVNQIGRC
jgi:glycosyltransferase involved in cell wall biosynthesis